MKIAFTRVKKEPQKVTTSIKIDEFDILFDGFISTKKFPLVTIEGSLSGKVNLVCDFCSESYIEELNENLDLLCSDGEYVQNGDEFLDVIEIEDNFLDINNLIESEIELIKLDYHKCSSCKK